VGATKPSITSYIASERRQTDNNIKSGRGRKRRQAEAEREGSRGGRQRRQTTGDRQRRQTEETGVRGRPEEEQADRQRRKRR
jgi:hypothetical protein